MRNRGDLSLVSTSGRGEGVPTPAPEPQQQTPAPSFPTPDTLMVDPLGASRPAPPSPGPDRIVERGWPVTDPYDRLEARLGRAHFVASVVVIVCALTAAGILLWWSVNA